MAGASLFLEIRCKGTAFLNRNSGNFPQSSFSPHFFGIIIYCFRVYTEKIGCTLRLFWKPIEPIIENTDGVLLGVVHKEMIVINPIKDFLYFSTCASFV